MGSVYELCRPTLYRMRLNWRARKLHGKDAFPFTYKNVSFSIMLDSHNGLVDKEIFASGVYEKEVMDVYLDKIHAGDTYVDIGANIGEHSLFASYVVGVTGHVISFEPITYIRQQFEESIKLNNIQNISVKPFACGNITETKTLHLEAGNIGASSLVPLADKKHESTEEIRIVRADDVLKEFGKVDFIKIDTEGYEYNVIQGLEQTLSQYHPSLLIEYSPMFYTRNMQDGTHDGLRMLETLQKYGYSLTDLGTHEKTNDLVAWGKAFTKDQTNVLCESA